MKEQSQSSRSLNATNLSFRFGTMPWSRPGVVVFYVIRITLCPWVHVSTSNRSFWIHWINIVHHNRICGCATGTRKSNFLSWRAKFAPGVIEIRGNKRSGSTSDLFCGVIRGKMSTCPSISNLIFGMCSVFGSSNFYP